MQNEDQVTEQKATRCKTSHFCHLFSEGEFGAVSNCSPRLSTHLHILPLNSLSIIHVQVDISALHGICCPTRAKPITLLGSCARARMSENERDVYNCSSAFVWVPCQRKCFLLPQSPKAQSCYPPHKSPTSEHNLILLFLHLNQICYPAVTGEGRKHTETLMFLLGEVTKI